MGVSFVHLLETYSIIVAAMPLDRWNKSAFALRIQDLSGLVFHIDPSLRPEPGFSVWDEKGLRFRGLLEGCMASPSLYAGFFLPGAPTLCRACLWVFSLGVYGRSLA